MLDAELKSRLEGWRFQSPDHAGYHDVVVPGKADCTAVSVARLNLQAGQGHTLQTGDREINAVLISGAARLTGGALAGTVMKRFDSFYLPAGSTTEIAATEDCFFYVAGAPFDGVGAPSFRAYDDKLPIGDIHQIHGEGAGRREVMFTLDPGTPASRLICGLTWGGVGTWTSWPPHQHEKDLEEAYCYFDMPSPAFGLHLSYLKTGETEDFVAHQVHTGTIVLAPYGYHPTVASPSIRNTYFWALAAFRPESRRYDLAIPDPALANL